MISNSCLEELHTHCGSPHCDCTCHAHENKGNVYSTISDQDYINKIKIIDEAIINSFVHFKYIQKFNSDVEVLERIKEIVSCRLKAFHKTLKGE